MNRAIVSPAAEADMLEAYQWYNAKDPDLALQFMMCVRETVDVIEKAPFRFPIAVADIRKAPVKKFPFGVWYVTDGKSIVIACLHSKRDGRGLSLTRVRALDPASD